MAPQKIDLATISDAEALLLHDFFNARRAEILPDDPPIPLEEHLRRWREPTPHEVERQFVVMDGDTVLGFAEASWRDDDLENPDTCWGEITLAPAAKRRGWGTRLAHTLLEEIVPLGRQKMFCSTNVLHPEGEPFVQMLGAKKGLEEHTNQVLFSELNLGYVQRSLEKAPTDRFELGFYDNEYPESELEAICEVYAIMNTAPRGDLEFNDWKVTPEQLREEVEESRKHQQQWWFGFVKDKATGRYAGFSQTAWHPNRPKVVNQWGTAVHPDFRGHGLGAWLKAAMIERIVRERPTVDRIRTGNADSNAPMLKINHTLGFKPFIKRVEWQIDLAKSLEVLRNRSAKAV